VALVSPPASGVTPSFDPFLLSLLIGWPTILMAPGLDSQVALIAFHCVDAQHTGKVLASEAMALLKRVGVTSQVHSSVQFLV